MADEIQDKPEEAAEKPTAPPIAEAPAEAPATARAAALEAEIAEARERLLRLAAEMENLRRRTERETADARQYAVSGFARDLLPVVDNLRRAVESAAPAGDAPVNPLVEGVEMTERELLRVLQRHGVRRLDPLGQKFDPHQHQAMFEIETADVPPGAVAQVAQPGYALGERVLRPALVAVAKTPRPAAQPASPVAEAETVVDTKA